MEGVVGPCGKPGKMAATGEIFQTPGVVWTTKGRRVRLTKLPVMTTSWTTEQDRFRVGEISVYCLRCFINYPRFATVYNCYFQKT